MLRLFFLFAFSLLLLTSCTKVPLTNRSQLNFVSEDVMAEMSLTTYEEYIRSHPAVSSSDSAAVLVNRVGKKIAAAVEEFLHKQGMEERLKFFSWEFSLVSDTLKNAWCLPGGKVVVYTGLLPVTGGEEGLAVVMGHEIAHAVAMHGSERMSQSLLTQAGTLLLSYILGDGGGTTSILNDAFGVASQLGIMLPYSRKNETEADRLGLIFMSMAGYDPGVAVDFWSRMKESSNMDVPELLSTHPDDEKRIEDIKSFLPEARQYFSSVKPI